MIIYLVGMSCVGKSTIGKLLAAELVYTFYDLDLEIQRYFNKPIERIQEECFSINGYREKASMVLDSLFSQNIDSVISGTPSGLKFYYLNIYKKHKKDKELYSIYLKDTFENVLNRLTFYDKDSKPIYAVINETNKEKYLKNIISDFNYFKTSYEKADYKITITDVNLNEIPTLIINELQDVFKLRSK